MAGDTEDSSEFAKQVRRRWVEEFGEEPLLFCPEFGVLGIKLYDKTLPFVFTLEEFIDIEAVIAKVKMHLQERIAA